MVVTNTWNNSFIARLDAFEVSAAFLAPVVPDRNPCRITRHLSALALRTFNRDEPDAVLEAVIFRPAPRSSGVA